MCWQVPGSSLPAKWQLETVFDILQYLVTVITYVASLMAVWCLTAKSVAESTDVGDACADLRGALHKLPSALHGVPSVGNSVNIANIHECATFEKYHAVFRWRSAHVCKNVMMLMFWFDNAM